MYIAIDIGGTNMRVAASASLSEPHFVAIKKLPIVNNYLQDLELLKTTISDLAGNEPVQGIGMGIAGDINADEGYIDDVHYFNTWNRKPVAADVSNMFHCTVKIQNDAATAGLGEAIYGQGQNENFLFLAWGSGFGGTAIYWSEKKPMVHAFDPGHQIIHQNGQPCVCGQKGCLQAYVGGKELHKLYGKDAHELSSAEWERVLEDVTQGLMNLVAIRPTRLMIFGGGVTINQQDKVMRLNDLLRSKLTIPPERIPTVKITHFGDNAALYGALALLA